MFCFHLAGCFSRSSRRRQGTHPSMPLGDLPPEVKRRRLKVECIDSDHVEVELLVSGVCTMAAVIPASWRNQHLAAVWGVGPFERLAKVGSLQGEEFIELG